MEEIKEKKREFVLPKKVVTLRPLTEKTPGMVKDSNHVASFLLPNCDRIYCTPKIKGSSELDFPLTEEELKFFENKEKSGLTFELGDLSPYSKKWSKKKSNKGGYSWWEVSSDAKVRVADQPIQFNLSKPMDYIRYKILLKNSDHIAASRDELRLKPSYLYVFEEANDISRTKASVVDRKIQAYSKLTEFSTDLDKMIDLCTVLGLKVSNASEKSFLIAALGQQIEDNVQKFLDAVIDDYYDEKILIGKLIKARLITRRGSSYFLTNGDPMCERGDIPNLENACIYLKADENQEVRLALEAKLKK